MNKILKKNYIVLTALIVCTVFLTFLLSNIYISKNKVESEFYEYANKITIEEFDEYMIENPDSIIYISDKYANSHENIEREFETKLDDLNLKDKLVYINKKDIKSSFLSKLKTEYSINIDLSKSPIVIVVLDKKVEKITYLTSNVNINDFIDYGNFQ